VSQIAAVSASGRFGLSRLHLHARGETNGRLYQIKFFVDDCAGVLNKGSVEVGLGGRTVVVANVKVNSAPQGIP